MCLGSHGNQGLDVQHTEQGSALQSLYSPLLLENLQVTQAMAYLCNKVCAQNALRRCRL